MRYFILCFLLICLFFVAGCTKTKDCGDDVKCFGEEIKDCSKAKVYVSNEGNKIKVTSKGLSKDECRVSLRIEEVGWKLKEDYPTESFIAKGKTLNCNIPIKENYSEAIQNLENYFDESCSGPIKDLLDGRFGEVIKKEIKQSLKF